MATRYTDVVTVHVQRADGTDPVPNLAAGFVFDSEENEVYMRAADGHNVAEVSYRYKLGRPAADRWLTGVWVLASGGSNLVSPSGSYQTSRPQQTYDHDKTPSTAEKPVPPARWIVEELTITVGSETTLGDWTGTFGLSQPT